MAILSWEEVCPTEWKLTKPSREILKSGFTVKNQQRTAKQAIAQITERLKKENPNLTNNF
ncbi:MAG: hypothetical protein ACJ72Q_19275 [Nitrososphaeraceae archaeon]